MFNFHTHTKFCDGASEPEKYVESALQKNFKALGFSGHAPVPFPNHFALTPENIVDYCQEIRNLQMKYSHQIDLFLGVEADFITGQSYPFDQFRKDHHLDYIIGSVHLVCRQGCDSLWFIDGSRQASYDEGLQTLFDGNIQPAVRRYFEQVNEMMETEHFEILGHFDKIIMHNQNRYFTTDESWYRKLLLETLDLARQKKLIVEINTRGLYKKRYWDFYPETQWLPFLKDMKIPVIISTDAHDPSELDLFVLEAKKALLNAGICEQMILTKTGFCSVPLSLND
ncbi:MAG: histidinol-phosphatase [Bacteroidales bacterium]|nr:histidinol-phosphatase [Bacteroidales bacterium]